MSTLFRLGDLQLVVGQALAYVVIAYVLLPLHFKLKLTSIYGYLTQRLGTRCRRTGAALFMPRARTDTAALACAATCTVLLRCCSWPR